MDDIFDTVINPDIELENQEKEERIEAEAKKAISYEEEYKEAELKLNGFYNFDKSLKLDIPTRLMSLYGIGQGRINSFRFYRTVWYEVRWKHIEFTLIETYVGEEKALFMLPYYRQFDDKGSFIRFAEVKKIKGKKGAYH